MKTVVIDAKMKELYYKPEEAKSTRQDIEHRFEYWNYMLNVSVQNMAFHSQKSAMAAEVD